MSIYELTDEEREFIIARLDREHIDELAGKIRTALSMDRAVEACYQPGDGTWYSLVFAYPDLHGAGGGGTQGQGPTSYIGRGRTFVAWIQKGTMSSFVPGDDMNWIAGKLSDNRASALAIAELLRAVADADA